MWFDLKKKCSLFTVKKNLLFQLHLDLHCSSSPPVNHRRRAHHHRQRSSRVFPTTTTKTHPLSTQPVVTPIYYLQNSRSTLPSTSISRSVGYNNRSPRHRDQPTQTTTHNHNRSPTPTTIDLRRRQLINKLILSPPSAGRTSSHHFTQQETHIGPSSCCLYSTFVFNLSNRLAAPATTTIKKSQKTRRVEKAFKEN